MESAPKTENKDELAQEEAVFEEQVIFGVNEYLQKEAEKTGEKFPPVYIKFFSSPHGTDYDARGIPKELEEADIYIPEYIGWTDDTKQEYNNISFGKIKVSPEDFRRNITDSFSQPILSAIASSGKPATFVDFPKDVSQTLDEAEEKFFQNRKSLNFLAYEEALDEMKALMKHEAEFHSRRENYMLTHLGTKIAETLRTYPELLAKNKITALITLGSGHSAIYHRLKKIEGDTLSRGFSEMPMLHDVRSQAIRSFMFKKDVDDELAKDMLTAHILSIEGLRRKLAKVTKDSLKITKSENIFLEIFRSEGKEVFETWQEGQKEDQQSKKEFIKEHGINSFYGDNTEYLRWREEKGLNTHDFSKYFKVKLLEKGIKMPENEKELDELLAGKYGVKIAKEVQG